MIVTFMRLVVCVQNAAFGFPLAWLIGPPTFGDQIRRPMNNSRWRLSGSKETHLVPEVIEHGTCMLIELDRHCHKCSEEVFTFDDDLGLVGLIGRSPAG